VIDKLDLRVPNETQFSPSFGRLYSQLRGLERGPFRPSKLYEQVGDLREYGHQARLGMWCRMDTRGNHKLELIDVGEMSRTDILREISSIFDIDGLGLGIMRVDFAVDIPDIPLQWFRETVRVENKRFRAAMTGERFYSEMGTGEIQTLYFGKRPNLIRIYNKQAERLKEHRELQRSIERSGNVAPTFESMFNSPSDAILTRVERQIGGRIPETIATLGRVIEAGIEYRPFAKLKILEHAAMPETDSKLSFETYCTGMYLRHIAENDGMQALGTFISKHSKGNAAWARRKYQAFLPSASLLSGLTQAALQSRFALSLNRQLLAHASGLVSSKTCPEAT
jgi:hypothetical protein